MILNKQLTKSQIQQLAMELAWEDLDKDDQKMYLSEGQKLYNKKMKEQFGEEFENISKLSLKDEE